MANEKIDGKIPPVGDGLLEKIKNTFFAQYEPVSIYEAGIILKSTLEIFQAMQKIYPTEILYSCADVAQWMHEKGFSFTQTSEMRFEWMLKDSSN
jgi:hypothetical protein